MDFARRWTDAFTDGSVVEKPAVAALITCREFRPRDPAEDVGNLLNKPVHC